MKRCFTVVWDASAEKNLAQLWNDNAAIRQEITEAADKIESTLAYEPASNRSTARRVSLRRSGSTGDTFSYR